MEPNNESVKKPLISTSKKEWSDPEIIILAINEVTLGGSAINDDGGGFSS